MAKKTRKTGEVLLDLEHLIDELVDQELQAGDILHLVFSYMEVHQPGCFEQYDDGKRPNFYYGPKEIK